MNNISNKINKSSSNRPSIDIIENDGSTDISRMNKERKQILKNQQENKIKKYSIKKNEKETEKEKEKEKVKIEEQNINNSPISNKRKDARGYPIAKGNKKYKVTFKDLVSKENLVHYIEIEDYKKYNISNNSQVSDVDNDNASCSCKIF